MAVFWDLSFEGGGRVRKFENVDVCQNDVAAKKLYSSHSAETSQEMDRAG